MNNYNPRPGRRVRPVAPTATIVHMVLVPAVIESLGKSAWWFPKWLEWLLKLNIEGSPELLEAEQDMKPTADASTAVNA